MVMSMTQAGVLLAVALVAQSAVAAAGTPFKQKKGSEWAKMSLAEIRTNVADRADAVEISYPKTGFALSTNTHGSLPESQKIEVGRGRTPDQAVFVVPAELYRAAKILVKADPDRKLDRVFTVRFTRYNDNGSQGTWNMYGRDWAGMVNVRVDFDACDKRKVGDMWEVTVPLDLGPIADLVWGGDMWGTWLNNTIRPGKHRVKPDLGNYLDFEVLSRLVEGRNPMQDHRVTVDVKHRSGITVYGATLVKSHVRFEVIQAQEGNVFHNDEKPEMSVRLTPRKGEVTLGWSVYTAEGERVDGGRVTTATERTVKVDLRRPVPGWYGIVFDLSDAKGHVMRHEASFALLGPDTRKTEMGEGPYGCWSYGGSHYQKSLEGYGPLFLKAGFRKDLGTGAFDELRKRYRLSPHGITWGDAKLTEEQRVEHVRRQLEANPHATAFLVLHEDAPYCYQQAWELTGQRIPNPTNEHFAGWVMPGWRTDAPDAEKKRAEALEKRRKRHELVMTRCGFMRKHFPQVRITLGNSCACTEIIAEAIRDGVPENYVDNMGIESVIRTQHPEREGDISLQNVDQFYRLAKHYGYDSWKVNAAFENCYRMDTLLGEDRQAWWYVRDLLLMQAWGFEDIFVGIMFDCGNNYGGSFWGQTGLCRRCPTAYPKKAFVAVATATKMLDRVVSTRSIPTGDGCVYVQEFLRRDGRCVAALWTSRGTTEVALELGGKPTFVDIYGRPYEPLRSAAGWPASLFSSRQPVVSVGEAVKYVLLEAGSRVVSAKKVAPTDLSAFGAPADAKLVAGTGTAKGWALEDKPNMRLEKTKGPFYPYRTKGTYALREVVDEERGKCLELELTKPNGALPPIMGEYAVVKLDKPIVLDQDPATLGAWVKGNSGWGKFYWLVEDEDRCLYCSCGAYASADVCDYEGTVSLCHTGWSFLEIPLDLSRSHVKDLSTGCLPGNVWAGGTFKKGKLKLVGFAFDALNRPLFLAERRPSAQKIRIGGIFASDFK